MDSLTQMTLQQIIAMARLATDPVSFGKQLLTSISGELSNAIRDELIAREDKLKLMKREQKVLSITFDS